MPPSLTRRLSFETSSILGSDGQFEGVKVTDCKIVPAVDADGVVDDSTDGFVDALSRIQQALRPCGGTEAIKMLALLRVRTKARAQGQDEDTLTAAAYADWLAQYPADIANAACEDWARGNVFWPAWVELQRVADKLVAPRLSIRKALQAALEPKKGALYLGKPKTETRAERLLGTKTAYLRHNRMREAGRSERELAAEEGRPVEDWAREEIPQPAPEPKAPRPPFAPGSSNTDKRMAELAKEWRAKRFPRTEAAE